MWIWISREFIQCSKRNQYTSINNVMIKRTQSWLKQMKQNSSGFKSQYKYTYTYLCVL